MSSYFQKHWMDRGRPRESGRCTCSSMCTCSAIHHPAGDRGCSGEDGIYNWRPFRHDSEHPRRQHVVLYLTLYMLSTQLALFVHVKVAVFHKTIPFWVVCESRANRALTQARPIDALHLTSSYMCVMKGVVVWTSAGFIRYSVYSIFGALAFLQYRHFWPCTVHGSEIYFSKPLRLDVCLSCWGY